MKNEEQSILLSKETQSQSLACDVNEEYTKMTSMKEKLLITGHRGMGVSDNPRDKIIEGEKFYPENSIAAFEAAIANEADALECDIHVSSDGVAMIIHGNCVANYAVPLKKENHHRIIEVEKYDHKQLQSEFMLKTHLEPASQQIKEYRLKIFKKEQKMYKIPMLTELLEIVLEENKKRSRNGKHQMILNIELKGHNSGLATIFALAQFKRQNPEFDMKNIVLLGRIELLEIVYTKHFLKTYFSIWERINTTQDKPTATYLLDMIDDIKDFEEFKCFKEEFHELNYTSKKKTTTTNSNILTDKEIKFFEEKHKLIEDKRKSIKENQNIKDKIEEIFKILKNKFNTYEDFKKYQTYLNTINSSWLKEMKQKSEFNDLEDHFKNKKPNLTVKKITKMSEIIRIFLKHKTHQDEDSLSYDDHQDKNLDCILKLITSMVKKNNETGEVEGLLEGIRTNVMLSTTVLYGKDCLLEDTTNFDLKPEIAEITKAAEAIIVKCFKNKYDGIDISLFDFNRKIAEIICEAKKANPNTKIIIGVTASNWKGTKEECALISMRQSLIRALQIIEYTDLNVLMKVDEPGRFRTDLLNVHDITTKQQDRHVTNVNHPSPKPPRISPTTASNTQQQYSEALKALEALEALNTEEAESRIVDFTTKNFISSSEFFNESIPNSIEHSDNELGERKLSLCSLEVCRILGV